MWEIPKGKRFPLYDKQRDGNVFHWILKASEAIRDEQIMERLDNAQSIRHQKRKRKDKV